MMDVAQALAAGAVARLTNSAGTAVPLLNFTPTLTAVEILALNPALYNGVTFDASDYYDTSFKSNGTSWRPKGGFMMLLNRQRSDIDRLVVASGVGSFDYTIPIPAWVLELSPETRVEIKACASAEVAQGLTVRESAFQILVDGTGVITPAVGTNSLSVSEVSIVNSGNVKTAQIITRSGTARTGLGATVDVVIPGAVSNRAWNIVLRLLNGAASTASNTLRLDYATVMVYVG